MTRRMFHYAPAAQRVAHDDIRDIARAIFHSPRGTALVIEKEYRAWPWQRERERDKAT